MITVLGEIFGTDNSFFKMWCSSVEPMTRLLTDHRHTDFEIAIIEKGSGVYTTTKGNKAFKKGDVFVFAGNEPHYITETGKDGLVIKNMHFNSRFISGAGSLVSKYPHICFYRSKAFDCRIPEEKAQEIGKCILLIEKEFNNKKQEYELAVRCYIEQIIIELIRNHGFLKESENGTVNTLSKISDAVQYIDFHFCEAITLEEIADYTCTSPNYLSHAFKKHFNMKIWDYVTYKRIEKAKELLFEEKEKNILAVAVDCGFNNTANFNRAFRTVTGITPREYRRCKEIIK